MPSIAGIHPQITHFPIVLLIMSALFELIGRALDLDWWRKGALALLVCGVVAGGISAFSGFRAADIAMKTQHIPDAVIEGHEQMAMLTLILGFTALLARLASGGLGRAAGFVSGLSFLLLLAAAVAVGVTGHRGGGLVFQHGAAVHPNGQPIISESPRP